MEPNVVFSYFIVSATYAPSPDVLEWHEAVLVESIIFLCRLNSICRQAITTVHSQCQDWRGLHPVYLHFEIQSQCKHHQCYPTSQSMVCCLSNTDQFNPGINQHAHRMWLQGQLGWLATIFGVLKGLCNVATRKTFFEDSVLGTEFHWDSSLIPQRSAYNHSMLNHARIYPPTICNLLINPLTTNDYNTDSTQHIWIAFNSGSF